MAVVEAHRLRSLGGWHDCRCTYSPYANTPRVFSLALVDGRSTDTDAKRDGGQISLG